MNGIERISYVFLGVVLSTLLQSQTRPASIDGYGLTTPGIVVAVPGVNGRIFLRTVTTLNNLTVDANGLTITATGGPSGPSGPSGPAGGPSGPSGPEGPTGPQGNEGVQGSPGVQGASGPSGPSGPATGVVGPSGPSGPSGAQGPGGGGATNLNLLYTGLQGSGPPIGPCTPTAAGPFYLDIVGLRVYVCGNGQWKLANL